MMSYMSGENELLAEIQRLLQAPGEALPTEVVNRLTLSVMINLDRRMREVERIAPVVKVIMWVGSLIGASIIGLIWSLIAGQASIVFS